MFENALKEESRSEEAELLTELVNKKDIETKTDIPNVYNQTVFEIVGFDFLDEKQQKNILKEAYDRPIESPISIGDYFMAFAHIYKVNAVSSKRKSREEYVRALGGVAAAREAQLARVVKGMTQ